MDEESSLPIQTSIANDRQSSALSAARTVPLQNGPGGVQVLQWLTFKPHMWLDDESDACFLDALSQLVELLHLQRHAKMRYRHRITIDCKAAQGRLQRQCMPNNSQVRCATMPSFLMRSWPLCGRAAYAVSSPSNTCHEKFYCLHAPNSLWDTVQYMYWR